jgi:phosphopantetheinyl transferase
MVLFEHRWAISLKEAILKANGVVLAQGMVRPEDLLALGANVALASATADQIEATSGQQGPAH